MSKDMQAIVEHQSRVIAAKKAEIERLRICIMYAIRRLEGARIWGGMEWQYNALHPNQYRMALDQLRNVLEPHKD